MNAFADILEAIAHAPIQKRAMTNLGVLNEAYAYDKPSSFSRGMRIDIGGVVILLISGTASIDEKGVSVNIGDFDAQLRRTFDNITGLLEAEGHLARHRAHQLLSARHRPRLRCIQRWAYGLFQRAGARSAARFHRHPGSPLPSRALDRDRGHRHVPHG